MRIVTKTGFLLVFFIWFGCSCGTDEKKTAPNLPGREADEPKQELKRIIFFGNSITAGYNLNKEDAFPALIQKKLDSLGYNYEVVNAGVSGETSSGGRERIDWVLQQPVHVFVLELGANDGLRGLPVDRMKQNLAAIIVRVRQKYPDAEILLTGMRIPPNYGQEYADDFHRAFVELAEEKDTHFITFLLDRVAANPELNLDDRIHPNEKGHRILAENIWEALKPIVEKQQAE